jgi:hypothetical protein
VVHAVSLTPHAQKIFEQLQKVKIICKTAMVCKKIKNAVSLTPHARFERPWQPLKGISIKNIYVPELSYPTTKKYINLKGIPNKKCRALTPHARFLRSNIDHLARESGPGGIV